MIDITSYSINNIIIKNESQKSRYMYLHELYKGKHSILKKASQGLNKACNRLVNPFYKQIVDYPASYFLGKPVVISHNTDDEIQKVLNNILSNNHSDDIFFETCKEADIKGVSALIVYQDELGDTRIVRAPAEEMIFCENPSTKELNWAIRYYTLEDVISNIYQTHVEVYTANDIAYYIKDYATGEMTLTKVEPHIYGAVPVIKVVSNEEEQSIVEIIESLVNDYDKILSDASDLHESYKRAYMVFKNAVLDDEAVQKLKEQSIIELQTQPGTSSEMSVDFLKLDIPQDAVEKHLDRLEDNIYKFSNTPDLTSEKFSGNLSGVAIEYKLYGLEVRAGQKERKFTRALKQLLKILATPIKLKTGKELKLEDVDIQYSRNIPANIKELADMVVALSGTQLIDNETLLSLLPFVSDPMAILQKVKVQQQEESGIDYPDNHDDSDEEVA